ncbi:checkpoint protein Hus1/Mec3 [Pseudomassariella vexata]|uniref:Checkpoint protein n=1 Tax=Pseudomassariella vexata TaxID=1141098 RepID=A0A1Y2EIA1_9PEZI|nr:checkpoint protein Hus1/Mec3 [Pseudomassariella vexata]ORY71300.1 checkpoint protein Hus1/Mec3 [Pseudomassariella vexata]
MRFKTNLKNVRTFSKLVAALSTLEKIAWMRLDDENVRFTVIPDTGSQVWASLSMDFIFDSWQLQSAEAQNTINLELPLGPLQRALKSALNGTSASLRLTKKDGIPILSMTITTTTASANTGRDPYSRFSAHNNPRDNNDSHFNAGGDGDDDDGVFAAEPLETHLHREREKIITQDIPVRVLHPETVETIMQPKVREPDVHIQLPPLLQLKAISDRYTKLALASRATSSTTAAVTANFSPKLELSANMHGSLRLALTADTLDIASQWDGLENPELDPGQLNCLLADHPSTKFKEEGPDKWASVRVDGKDWSKVLSVGRLEGRVIACFADDHALILYVYVPQYDDASAEDSVVTYYVSSYSL